MYKKLLLIFLSLALNSSLALAMHQQPPQLDEATKNMLEPIMASRDPHTTARYYLRESMHNGNITLAQAIISFCHGSEFLEADPANRLSDEVDVLHLAIDVLPSEDAIISFLPFLRAAHDDDSNPIETSVLRKLTSRTQYNPSLNHIIYALQRNKLDLARAMIIYGAQGTVLFAKKEELDRYYTAQTTPEEKERFEAFLNQKGLFSKPDEEKPKKSDSK